MEDDEKILQAFMNSYGADIWDAAIIFIMTPHLNNNQQKVMLM